MITRIEGTLEAMEGDTALVAMPGGVVYGVLVSSYDAGRLASQAGQPITLYTLHYFESQNQGATLLPRLAGFVTQEDRRFFELLTSVKGIGNRKALRAMAMETGVLAAAIVDRDTALLQSLPEIGQRTAETIVVSLKGKMDKLVAASAFPTAATGAAARGGKGSRKGQGSLERDALEVLMSLGENRQQVVVWMQAALAEDTPPRDVQELIERIYRIKAGS